MRVKPYTAIGETELKYCSKKRRAFYLPRSLARDANGFPAYECRKREHLGQRVNWRGAARTEGGTRHKSALLTMMAESTYT